MTVCPVEFDGIGLVLPFTSAGSVFVAEDELAWFVLDADRGNHFAMTRPPPGEGPLTIEQPFTLPPPDIYRPIVFDRFSGANMNPPTAANASHICPNFPEIISQF